MEVLDINNFLSYKSNNTVLDNKTLDYLFSLFGHCNKKKKVKSNVNVLKNRDLQGVKENISNKINLILNKLSDSNVDNLIIEFIDNIGQISFDDYLEVQKTFYLKILTEINFIKIYLLFLKNINFIYNKAYQYDLTFFISIINSKFNLDYCNSIPVKELDEKLLFLNNYKDQEDKRLGNLLIIKTMCDNKIGLFNNNIISYCTNILLEQKYNLVDIYYWFNYLNRELTVDEKEKIKLIIDNQESKREIVLLENLLNISVKNIDKVNNEVVVIKKTDTLLLEIENIIEEYLSLKLLNDVEYFIESRCIDANSKNKFCELLIHKYLVSNKNNADAILELINEMISNQIIFKSNVSRGLVLITTNWKDKIKHFNKPKDKMVLLLNNMKNNGITKGIESLFSQFSVSL